MSDERLDLEFAYVDHRSSCRDPHTIAMWCRRPRGHTPPHAAGFGQGRVRWGDDTPTHREGEATP